MKNRTTNPSSKMVLGLAICMALIAMVGHTATEVIALGPALGGGFTEGSVTYSAVGSHGINAAFAQSGVMNGPVSASIVVDEGVAGSPFHGDYIETAINTISMELSGSGHQPTSAWLKLYGGSRLWLRALTFPATAGTVSAVAVPLRSTDGWLAPGTSSLTADEKSAALAGDLADVTALEIVLMPQQISAYYPAQNYTIDNFVLINDDGISSQPASLTPLEKALIARFGYGYGSTDALTDEMKGWDEDGDGMADFMELWSENDEEYANSIFSAEDIEVVAGGVNVTWTCVAGETYTVVKADSLDGEFHPVDGLTATASETGYMALTDTGSAAGGYYRIRKH